MRLRKQDLIRAREIEPCTCAREKIGPFISKKIKLATAQNIVPNSQIK